MQKKTNVVRIIIMALSVVLLSAGFYYFIVPKLQFNSLVKKENNLLLFMPKSAQQEIYILGTIHTFHYDRSYKYSLANIQSVIDTINPDILLIEARQETLDEFDVVDGPSEMIFAYCYAKEKNIEVKGIDSYQIDDFAQSAYTDDSRDDKIFENTLANIEGRQRILVLYGAEHRVEQGKRFACNGFIKVKIQNILPYFNAVSDEDFQYPHTIISEMAKKIEYSKTEFVEEVLRGTTAGSEEQTRWLEQANDTSAWESMVNDLYIPNQLYD